MQRAEMEELRHREANNTALQAIGPRKKLKLDPDATTTTVRITLSLRLSFHSTIDLFHLQTTTSGNVGTPTGTKATAVARPRIKRVNMRDMIFYMEQEKDSCRSTMLYKAYLK